VRYTREQNSFSANSWGARRAENTPMKTILTIVFLLVVMIVVKTSHANSQDACSQGYVGCVDACLKKPGGQDQCIAMCQQKNDQCAAGVYGVAPQTTNAQRPKESGEAMDARDDASAEPVKEAPKPRAKASAAKAPQR
jgi:hypothetical protein